MTKLKNSTLRHCVLAYLLIIRLIGEDSYINFKQKETPGMLHDPRELNLKII